MRRFGGLVSWDSRSELEEHLGRFGRWLLVGDGSAERYSTILPGDPPLMLGILAGTSYPVPSIFRLNEDVFVIAFDSCLAFVDVEVGKVAAALDLFVPFEEFIELAGWSFLAVYELDVLRFDRNGRVDWHIGTPHVITRVRLEGDDTLRIWIDDGTVARIGVADGRAFEVISAAAPSESDPPA